MKKLDNDLMQGSLQKLCQPGEHFLYPVYCGFGSPTKFSTSAMNNSYGFIAVTNQRRILITQFNALAVKRGEAALPLSLLKSVKIGKNLFGQYSLKLIFSYQGKEEQVRCTISRNVYGMGIKNQSSNLDGLLGVLNSLGKG